MLYVLEQEHSEKQTENLNKFIKSTTTLCVAIKNCYTSEKKPNEEITKSFFRDSQCDDYLSKLIFNFFACTLILILIPLGLTIGFFSGLFSRIKIYKGAPIGTIMGVAISCMIANRLPRKLLKDPLNREKHMCVDQILRILPETFNESCQDDIVEINKINKILNENEKVSYQLITMRTPPSIPQLQGHLGQHQLIRFFVDNKQHVIELGDQVSYNGDVEQSETRSITGSKLADMMLTHNKLQKQYGLAYEINNFKQFFSFYKPGERDCHTYVDAILVANGESPTSLKRFGVSDRYIGKNILSPIFEFLSPPNRQNHSIDKAYEKMATSILCGSLFGLYPIIGLSIYITYDAIKTQRLTFRSAIASSCVILFGVYTLCMLFRYSYNKTMHERTNYENMTLVNNDTEQDKTNNNSVSN